MADILHMALNRQPGEEFYRVTEFPTEWKMLAVLMDVSDDLHFSP